MAGISSLALQFGKYNRYRYNGIELDTSLGLDNYEAKLRDLDPQTGRWWQVDPKSENTEDISPYASNNNNPIRFKDPDGDAPCDPCITAPIEEWINNTADAEPSVSGEVHLVGTAVVGLAMLWDAVSSSDAMPGNGSMTGIPSSSQMSALHTNMATPVPAKVSSTSSNPKEIVIDGTKHPESATHAQEAVDKGASTTGTVDRGGKGDRRRDNLKDTKTESGKDRDEYPPAVIKPNGGQNSIQLINPSDNRDAGGSIGQQLRNVPDGTRVVIKIIPPPKPPVKQ